MLYRVCSKEVSLVPFAASKVMYSTFKLVESTVSENVRFIKPKFKSNSNDSNSGLVESFVNVVT